MSNETIQDLDDFVAYLETRRLSKAKKDKIIEAVDIVENAIEQTGY